MARGHSTERKIHLPKLSVDTMQLNPRPHPSEWQASLSSRARWARVKAMDDKLLSHSTANVDRRQERSSNMYWQNRRQLSKSLEELQLRNEEIKKERHRMNADHDTASQNALQRSATYLPEINNIGSRAYPGPRGGSNILQPPLSSEEFPQLSTTVHRRLPPKKLIRLPRRNGNDLDNSNKRSHTREKLKQCVLPDIATSNSSVGEVNSTLQLQVKIPRVFQTETPTDDQLSETDDNSRVDDRKSSRARKGKEELQLEVRNMNNIRERMEHFIGLQPSIDKQEHHHQQQQKQKEQRTATADIVYNSNDMLQNSANSRQRSLLRKEGTKQWSRLRGRKCKVIPSKGKAKVNS